MKEDFVFPAHDANAPSNSNNQFAQFQNSIKNVIEKHIPESTNTANKEWMTPEILKLMEERRGYERGSEKYRLVNKEIKTKCKIAHEEFLDLEML